MVKKWIAAMLVLGILAPSSTVLASEPSLTASSAALMDVTTKRLLASKNAHKRMPMASTTKVMTALVALENGAIDTMVTVPEQAYGIEGSSMYLEKGEELSMEDLLYGLMLASGNDAAVTIAMHIAGSVEGFIEMMNAKAKELGCLNTNFVTPNGLDAEGHYTTAYDLAIISAEAMQNPQFREIVNTQYHTTTTGDKERILKNKNKILWQYEGGNGVKTGYTDASGKCLVYSAERDGNTTVGVVLRAGDMWGDATEYLDFGFESYTWEPLVNAGETYAKIIIDDGMENSLEAVAKDDIIVPVIKDGGDEPKVFVDCVDMKEAPIYTGEVLGQVEVWLDGVLLSSTQLIAKNTVQRKEYPFYLYQIITDFTA